MCARVHFRLLCYVVKKRMIWTIDRYFRDFRFVNLFLGCFWEGREGYREGGASDSDAPMLIPTLGSEASEFRYSDAQNAQLVQRW